MFKIGDIVEYNEVECEIIDISLDGIRCDLKEVYGDGEYLDVLFDNIKHI